jgi:hypothetical protein
MNASKTKVKPFDNFMYWLTMAFFSAGIVFLLFEIRTLENTVGGFNFFWAYALLGVFMFIVITAVLKIVRPSVYADSNRSFSVHGGLFLGFFLFLPSAASCVNHHFCSATMACRVYKIERKSTGGYQNRASWIFIRVNGEKERFTVSRRLWNSINEREPVVLCTRKGLLGYDFVEEFRTAAP